MKLYLDTAPTEIDKTAAAQVALPDDASTWPTEILQEVYKQIPYVSDYALDVHMDRVESERGFGFGHVEVKSKTEIQPRPEAEEQVGVRTVRIPIIVKDKELLPLDILVADDAKMFPLTEHRIRQALFRPQVFDIAARPPGDQSMVAQLYPPSRAGGGAFGGIGKIGSAEPSLAEEVQKALGVKTTTVGDTGTKTKDLMKSSATNIPNSSIPTSRGASVKEMTPVFKTGSILEAIRSSVNPSDLLDMGDGLTQLLMKNASARNAIELISQFDVGVSEKIASSLPHMIRPDVVQIARGDWPGEYTVKAASRQYWSVFEEEIDRGTLIQRFGEKIATDVDLSGAVTISGGENGADASLQTARIISQPGTYKVMDTMGRELLGVVFPNLIDPANGKAMPSALFFNGSQTAYQADIVGTNVGDVTGLINGPAAGYGVFVFAGDEGMAATLPVEVKGGTPGGYLIEKADGTTLTYDAPSDAQFVPLHKSDAVTLVSSTDAAAVLGKQASEYVTLRAAGYDSFSLSGGSVDKLASEQREWIGIDEALFLMGGLGLTPDSATEKIAEAVGTNAPVTFASEGFALMEERNDESMKTAQAKMPSFPKLRRSLVKEAESISDPMAVDTILSLGFVNPDNMYTFVTYLPQMELTQSRLCEMLVASRLGLQAVPTNALERTVRTLEEVIQGLKVLAFQRN